MSNYYSISGANSDSYSILNNIRQVSTLKLCYLPTAVSRGVATGGARRAECHPDSEQIAKNWEKEGKNQEKLGKKKKNREGSFTLPLLTDRAGYATGCKFEL